METQKLHQPIHDVTIEAIRGVKMLNSVSIRLRSVDGSENSSRRLPAYSKLNVARSMKTRHLVWIGFTSRSDD